MPLPHSLTEPIQTKDGSTLRTLSDVVDYMDSHVEKERIEHPNDRWNLVAKAALDRDMVRLTEAVRLALFFEMRLRME